MAMTAASRLGGRKSRCPVRLGPRWTRRRCQAAARTRMVGPRTSGRRPWSRTAIAIPPLRRCTILRCRPALACPAGAGPGGRCRSPMVASTLSPIKQGWPISRARLLKLQGADFRLGKMRSRRQLIPQRSIPAMREGARVAPVTVHKIKRVAVRRRFSLPDRRRNRSILVTSPLGLGQGCRFLGAPIPRIDAAVGRRCPRVTRTMTRGTAAIHSAAESARHAHPSPAGCPRSRRVAKWSRKDFELWRRTPSSSRITSTCCGENFMT
mmetsp:Transcript_29980/g.78981  ORF Transcript_29980/g.78981 Transcript_29980/m.78981 type:complete len:266 (+) Transcript_29980:403-1200(+)